jgi:hypothetical protein
MEVSGQLHAPEFISSKDKTGRVNLKQINKGIMDKSFGSAEHFNTAARNVRGTSHEHQKLQADGIRQDDMAVPTDNRENEDFEDHAVTFSVPCASFFTRIISCLHVPRHLCVCNT